MKMYEDVALFICNSLFEHKLNDNGLFHDKDVKEVLKYFNPSAIDPSCISEKSEQCNFPLQSRSAAARDESLLSEKTDHCSPMLDVQKSDEFDDTVKLHEETEDLEVPAVLFGKFIILLKVMFFN